MKRMHVLTLLMVAFVSIFSAAGTTSTPLIFYSDLQSGPNSGGQNNQGLFVTLYGVGFGSAQGSSKVTIGGGAAANYPLWSDSKIVFQLGANAATGNIVVHANSAKSNGVRFVVRTGNIYFVSPNGNDSANGSYGSPWQTLTHARTVVVRGDTVYLMDGTQQTGLDSNNASLAISEKGTSGNPIALVAYPGANVTLGSATGGNYGIYAAKSSFWVIAGVHLLGSVEALHLANSQSWRIVGNDITCPNASSAGGCLDGTSSGSVKVYGNTIHDSGLAGTALPQYDSVVFTDSNGLEIGWNEIARTNACNAVHAVGVNITPTNLSIHDNWIHDAVCSGILLPDVNASTSPVRIYNNVIARVGSGPSPGTNATFACVSVGGAGSGSVQILDNTWHDCGAGGGSQSGALSLSTPVTFEDNLVDLVGAETYVSNVSDLSGLTGSNNLFNGAGSGPSQLTSSVNADPQFVDPTHDNYQLQSTSPAIDAGMTTGIANDVLGVVRPQGSAYDIGAYEFTGQVSQGLLGPLQASPSALSFGSVTDGSNSTLSVTLTNSGTAPVTILQSAVSGTGFSSPGVAPSTTIAAGGTLAVQVTFAPTSATSYSGTLTVTSDASNSSLVVDLSGAGQALQATLSASPASLAFGNVNTGSSVTQAVTVTNTGNGAASISNVSVAGAGFSVSGMTTPFTLTAGASATLNVTFAPTSAIGYSGTLTVTSNASNSSLGVPLSGTGIQPPQAQLSASPASVSFGNVNTGSSSAQSVVIKNNGNASATINQIGASGAGFTLSGAPVTPYTLAAGATISLNVTFAPTTVNTYSGTLTVASNASNSNLTVPLSGTGTQPPQGQLAASPVSLNFGSVNTGATSTQSVKITNTGNASASISQVGEAGSGFSNSGITTPYTLAAGASVTITVTFAPTSVTTYSGTITLTSNASNSQLAIPLSGTGAQVSQGQLTANPSSVNFGSLSAGNAASQSVTLTNSGSASVDITQVAESGSGFTASGITVPYALASGASVTLQISFAPPLAGSYSGTVVVSSNADNPQLSIPLSGTATHSVGLSWTDASSGIAGYNVYRSAQSGGPYTKINTSLISTMNSNDDNVQPGQTYYYVITAVGSNGMESGYSPQASATIPNP